MARFEELLDRFQNHLNLLWGTPVANTGPLKLLAAPPTLAALAGTPVANTDPLELLITK
jgi:hypothetical protein